jgi:hypothetical protein
MRVFKGPYQEYLEVLEVERAADETIAKPKQKAKEEVPAIDPKVLQRLEAQIIALEDEIKELETLLAHASAAGNSDTIITLSKQYKAQQQRLAELNIEWEELAEKV